MLQILHVAMAACILIRVVVTNDCHGMQVALYQG